MRYSVSRCICLQHPDANEAAKFYEKVFGLRPALEEGPTTELAAGHLRLFFDAGERLGPVFEFLVPDAEMAKAELLAAGCSVVRWEGPGRRCYLRDPFGFVFNLYEDRAAFAEGEYDSTESKREPAEGPPPAQSGEYVP